MTTTLITGANRSLGLETARRLIDAGHTVYAGMRDLATGDDVRALGAHAVQLDVTDQASVDAAFATLPALDVLVNNAGVTGVGVIEEVTDEQIHAVFETNFFGPLRVIRGVLPAMRERESGTIINVSSVAGRKTFPNHVAYVGTKFAVHGISENLREELSPSNVRVITIAPGAVETELLSHTTDERIKAGYHDWKDQMGGVIAPEVIADAVLYAWHQPANVCVREIVLAATRQQP